MLLMTTVDDLPAEGLPYIIEKTLERGANNVHVINAVTKKGRMEYIVLVDLDRDRLDDICSLIALEFGTLGMKIFHSQHLMLPYEIETKKVTVRADQANIKSKIRIKYLKNDENKVISLKTEYEDVKETAEILNNHGIEIAFSKLKTIIEAEAYKNILQNKEIIIAVLD